ncbi:hypothetical protein HanRHA438_Chr07g0318791 [Helianthus annuus]|nr:hypothetical protein HanRHA438_Chr07g0318791 [Helianthus annuus]
MILKMLEDRLFNDIHTTTLIMNGFGKLSFKVSALSYGSLTLHRPHRDAKLILQCYYNQGVN